MICSYLDRTHKRLMTFRLSIVQSKCRMSGPFKFNWSASYTNGSVSGPISIQFKAAQSNINHSKWLLDLPCRDTATEHSAQHTLRNLLPVGRKLCVVNQSEKVKLEDGPGGTSSSTAANESSIRNLFFKMQFEEIKRITWKIYVRLFSCELGIERTSEQILSIRSVNLVKPSACIWQLSVCVCTCVQASKQHN